MVVIETYFPGAHYEANDAAREDYSQMLGARAAAAPPGVPVTRWKRYAKKPPKPTLAQTKRPKRLLINDLTIHLRPYACAVDYTIVVMGIPSSQPGDWAWVSSSTRAVLALSS